MKETTKRNLFYFIFFILLKDKPFIAYVSVRRNMKSKNRKRIFVFTTGFFTLQSAVKKVMNEKVNLRMCSLRL
jgi:hypothetical protein